MNVLKSISVVISFSKISEIEHSECKSQMMHANEEGGCMQICGIRLQTSLISLGGMSPT